MKEKKDEYPRVKYRIINGYGYSVVGSMDEVKTRIKEDRKKYPEGCDAYPRYVVKITEEYIDLDDC